MAGGRRCCAPGTARARGHVAVVARLRRLVKLRRVAGLPGAVAAAGGAVGRTGGGIDACCHAILAAPSREALQAAAFLIKDLEEQRGGAVVLEMDGEGPLRAAGAGDLAPSASDEDLARGDDC